MLGRRVSAIATVVLVASVGCAREPSLPDGVLMGLQPLDGTMCVAVDTKTETGWWWQIGGEDCHDTASSVVETTAQVEAGSLRFPSLRIAFTIDLIPHGTQEDATQEVSAKLAELDGRIVFVTSDQKVIPTVVTDRLPRPPTP